MVFYFKKKTEDKKRKIRVELMNLNKKKRNLAAIFELASAPIKNQSEERLQLDGSGENALLQRHFKKYEKILPCFESTRDLTNNDQRKEQGAK